jgi:phosphopantothenoylcysteine decarboxylase/phosphopantothenate--cysteine ligase
MENVSGRRIVLGIGGGIAAYKVVEVARELTQAGADVRVVMTEAAKEFVGPITFSTLTGNPVETELFPDPAPGRIPHTFLGRSADLVVVAPATANLIAKFALGLADDLLSSVLLATRAPIVMAPAMHTEMWENEATVRNIQTLRSRGVRMVDPEEGPLAGPDVGVGRLADTTKILEAIDQGLGVTQSLDGVRVVVTAGGTQEPIDAVRFIGNRSSGLMGFEIAHEALRRGAKVVLISAPTHLVPPEGLEFIPVETAAEMSREVRQAAEESKVVVMAAAVADWRPANPASDKLKKAQGTPNIELVPNHDILEQLGKIKGDRVLVGFAAETSDLEGNAAKKLAGKNLDLVVANLVGVDYSGFGSPTSSAFLIDRNGNSEMLDLVGKRQLAARILDWVSDGFL